jgi:hypothetical protein
MHLLEKDLFGLLNQPQFFIPIYGYSISMNQHPGNNGHHIEVKPSKKNKRIRLLIRLIALNFIIWSILLIILGLMPQDKLVVENKELQPVEIGISESVELEKGEILILDYSLEGKDAAFYLTYGDPWSSSNQEYLEKKDHASLDHFEIEAENSGFYYLNFQSNDVSSSGTFQVTMSYKVQSRFSPIYIFFGIVSLVIGLALTIFYVWLKKSPHVLEDEYIRI